MTLSHVSEGDKFRASSPRGLARDVTSEATASGGGAARRGGAGGQGRGAHAPRRRFKVTLD